MLILIVHLLYTTSTDVFDAFLETGDIFHAGTAERLLRCVYSAGNSVEPGQAFRDFRGREPAVQAMLRKKGLDEGAYIYIISVYVVVFEYIYVIYLRFMYTFILISNILLLNNNILRARSDGLIEHHYKEL